ncbi:Pyruvate kinase [Roseomonas mucosa]|uniref:Pyruvate kinase n=1 Tax=Roseomonas mucosa TaxID=207340 RepID=A0A379MYJ7_9PROT|nr:MULTISPECIES: pyruvate kinase [Roseomonas]MCG7350850.1 pyruvate kinase [Roseomonas mucosa]MCG7356320.1 pyruvate kinase [Roseomonas mucosa]MDT8289007.1 pyruvate kinase [Roseomonas mucosa]MDT8295205.1 pyruvate kinase [Roseomonas mucosa]MDT8314059.1 pyruvate kinase [Roseomonas mucosa]
MPDDPARSSEAAGQPIPEEDRPVDVPALHAEIRALLKAVREEGRGLVRQWEGSLHQPDFRPGAENLACYLALRHRDLRPLQRPLMLLGLSSLGRLESRVLPVLESVERALAALAGRPPEEPLVSPTAFFDGERHLAERTRMVLGPASPQRPVHLLVTCPSEAADDPAFMRKLAERGVEAVRINCAHDGREAWQRMIAHVHAAEAATGRRMKVIMDLGGPKIRTGEVRVAGAHRVAEGDRLVVTPPGGIGAVALEGPHAAVECTLGEVLTMVRPGERLFIDDGKLGASIERVESWGLVARVSTVAGGSMKLKAEKGINFPDTDLHCAALTDQDRQDLDFVARHADGIGYSFVQSAQDVALLQEELQRRRPDDWRNLSLILKIETTRAVRALPAILTRAAGQQPTAIMIARGDLAVEIGFARMAEMQEEILWLGEAAHVPVIWATQVLERLIKKGAPSRGEMTDAAMAARAECVMLNKGPYLHRAIAELDSLLGRMGEHQHKKTPRLRRLRSW